MKPSPHPADCNCGLCAVWQRHTDWLSLYNGEGEESRQARQHIHTQARQTLHARLWDVLPDATSAQVDAILDAIEKLIGIKTL